MTLSLVSNLLILFSCGLLAAVICRWLKVSVSIGYVVVGALIGQGGIGWVFGDDHELAHVAEVGVFLLFFSIGLEFSLDDLKRLGKNFIF